MTSLAGKSICISFLFSVSLGATVLRGKWIKRKAAWHYSIVQQEQRFTNRYPLCSVLFHHADSPQMAACGFLTSTHHHALILWGYKSADELYVLRISENIAVGTNDANKFHFITMDSVCYICLLLLCYESDQRQQSSKNGRKWNR